PGDVTAEGIWAAAVVGAARRQRRPPPVPAPGGLGVAPPARHALSAHLRAQAPAEDRGRPDPAADTLDRARGRISPGGAGSREPGRGGELSKPCGFLLTRVTRIFQKRIFTKTAHDGPREIPLRAFYRALVIREKND